MMFRGPTPLALDGKGRLAIPTKYRDLLMQRCGGHLVVTLDPSNCLLLYPFPDWEPIEQKLNALPSFNPVNRMMQRILVGSASDVEMDGTGRILLPALLRDRARLEKDVVLVGQGNKFEIWSAADWQTQFDAAEQLPAMLNEALQKGEMPDELKGFSL
jgi:MraZ protein